MTIIEAINTIDTLKPNTYSQGDKIHWLSQLDGMIVANILSNYEDPEGTDYCGYDIDTPLDTKLIIGAPWDDIYIKWLEAQIDYASCETKRYNNSASAYNAAYTEFARYYNRTYMPKETRIKYF